MVYEIAYAYATFLGNFKVYSLSPRHLIPQDTELSQLPVQSPVVLVVEECDGEEYPELSVESLPEEV